jgi:hypothetical protein
MRGGVGDAPDVGTPEGLQVSDWCPPGVLGR